MGQNGHGVHIRYLLLVRGLSRLPSALGPTALVIRCYDNGETTICEETWEG